jgi:hypothetical protein
MKRIALILSISALALVMLSCGGSTEQKANDEEKVVAIEKGKVVVYYFHAKQRCKTCVGVQNLAEETFAENFSSNPNVQFIEIDFTERANAPIADRYEIAFSSLVVAGHSEHIDLSEIAFANVFSNPDVVKERIVTEVNNYLIN